MNNATITIETHNDGLNVRERTLPLSEALSELQGKLDAGVYGGCFALADALLFASRNNRAAFKGLKALVRIPARDGLRDSLIDRLEGVNREIRYASR